jgi:type I restriction enzyme M protein
MTQPHRVLFINARTCGIYKSGGIRYKTDPQTGQRTDQIDNELIEAVDALSAGKTSASTRSVALQDVEAAKVLVPTYFDNRYNQYIDLFLKGESLQGVTLGELLKEGVLSVRGGHGSPGNDQRSGTIPYVKVSDIRALRVNINPTNMVTEAIARRYWRGESSGLKAWDLITPNRASSNIGEFAIILPGEEQVVLTKEMFLFRVQKTNIWDPFILLWALSLKAVREQWRRITLMQTNREDCGDRYKEIVLPLPRNRHWAEERSQAFRDYFNSLAVAKSEFASRILTDKAEYIATVLGARRSIEEEEIAVGEQAAPDDGATVID